MKIIDFVQGLTFHKTSKESKFYKELKKIFSFSNIPFYDPCCPEAFEGSPVKMTEGLESLVDGVWTPVPAGSISLPDAASFATSVTTPTLAVDTIGADTGAYIQTLNGVVSKRFATAVDVTATTTGVAIAKGLITSTSAAAVALTLPLATDLATAIGAVQGTSVDFMVDNSAGANTVTVTPNTGITAVTAVVTGGATLTVASGAVGIFRIFFTSATVAKIARII